MKNKLDKIVGQEGPNMKSQPNLVQQKSGIYQFRFVIPSDVQKILNKKVVKISLKTSSKNEAIVKASRLRATWIAEVSKARSQPINNTTHAMSATDSDQIYITESGRVIDLRMQKLETLPDEQIKRIAKTYLRSLLGYDEDFRLSDTYDVNSKVEITNRFIESNKLNELSEAVSNTDNIELFYPIIAPFVESVFKIDFHYLSGSTKTKLTHHCLREYRIACKTSESRNESWIELDDVVPLNISQKISLNLWEELFDDWKKSKIGRPNKTIESFHKSLMDFKEFCKQKPVEDLKPIDALEYKKFFVEKIEKDLIKISTANNKLAHLNAIFAHAKMNEKIDKNIFHGKTSIALSSNTEDENESHVPFSIDELNSVFNSAIFKNEQSINAWNKKTNYWLIALAYATGARSEEIAQLRTEDLVKRNNCYFLNISNKDSNNKIVGTIKNKSSIRQIPIHKILIDAGIEDFFNEQKANGHFYLFNDLMPNKHGKRYASWGNWFNRFIKRELKIHVTTFYSFRGSFADICRNSDLSDAVMKRFMGHTGNKSKNDISNNYGVGHDPQFLHEKMQQLKFPLSLP